MRQGRCSAAELVVILGMGFGGNWDLREKKSAGSIPAFLGVITCGLAVGVLLNLGLE